MPRKKRYEKRGRPQINPPIRIVELGEEYVSLTDVANRVKGNRGAIHACADGTRRTHAGFTYEYTEAKKKRSESSDSEDT